MSKPKLNPKDFIFEKIQGQTLEKVPGQINGIQFNLDTLENCEVYLMDYSAQVFVDDCKNCHIFIGPVETSLFVRNCENLKISGACKQFRLSDSKNIDCHIYAASDPTLENAQNIRFAPYNFFYPRQDEHFQKAGLDPATNFWSQIFDFNENKSNPNWSLLPPQEFPGPVYKSVDGEPEPFNPVEIPVQYGGTLQGSIMIGSQEQGGTQVGNEMMEFSIKTNQNEAENQFANKFEQHEEAPIDNNNIDNNVVVTEEQYADLFNGGSNNQNNQSSQPFQQTQPQQYDDFDFNSPPQNTQTQVSQPVQQNNNQAGFDGFDDAFGSAPTTKVTTTTTSNQGGFAQDFNYSNDPNYDPEEQERILRLRKLEEERMYKLDLKARAETEKKQERRNNAALELHKWMEDTKLEIEKRKIQNRQENAIKREAQEGQTYKNSWDKITSNIALKDGEYPGTKDVSKFRQALLNKRNDGNKLSFK